MKKKAVVVTTKYNYFMWWVTTYKLDKSRFIFANTGEKVHSIERGTDCYLLHRYFETDLFNREYDRNVFLSRDFNIREEDDIDEYRITVRCVSTVSAGTSNSGRGTEK